MTLKKQLSKLGNSYAIVIDKPILEFLNLDENTVFDVTTDDGRRLIITPSSDKKLPASTEVVIDCSPRSPGLMRVGDKIAPIKPSGEDVQKSDEYALGYLFNRLYKEHENRPFTVGDAMVITDLGLDETARMLKQLRDANLAEPMYGPKQGRSSHLDGWRLIGGKQ